MSESESKFDFSTLFEGAGTGFLGFVAEKVSKEVAKLWETVKFRQAALAYIEKMQRLHGMLNILGKSAPVPLEGVFTDVYILEELSALRRLDLQRLVEDDSLLQHKSRHNGLMVVKHFNKPRLFILGKPGAGKTTFLKYITLQALKGEIHKIPIFVDLKIWASKNCPLMEYLVQQFDICNFPDARPWIEYQLEQGQALVLFDGLDEVQQEGRQRDKIISEVNDFVKKYLDSQYLVTCRIAASDYRMDLFTYMEVADFTDEQIRVYVQRWFCHTPISPEQFLSEFDKPEHQGLRDLARTPLLLNLLCLHFEQNLRFSNKREEIYEDAFDALLRRWDAHRGIRRDEIYRKLTPNRKKQLFARLAYDTFTKGKLFFKQQEIAESIGEFLQKLPPADTQEDIDGEEVLKAIEAQHGILTERAYKIYSFSHKTFQEYFTAKYIIEDPQRVAEMITTRLTNDNWREVFLLVASLLDDASAFANQLRQTIDKTIKSKVELISKNELVKLELELVQQLTWAQQKAAIIKTSHKQLAAIRISYLALNRALSYYDRDRDRALDIRDFVRAHISIARAFDLDLDRALNFVLDLDRAYTGVYQHANKLTDAMLCGMGILADLDLDLDLDLDHALTLTLPVDLKIDFLLTYCLQVASIFQLIGIKQREKRVLEFNIFFAKMCQLCREFPCLQHALRQLVVPKNTQTTWKDFAQSLREIMQRERNIGHKWEWTVKQNKVMERYFQANLLLVECMKVAALDKKQREAIENSLLLPSV